GAAVVAARVRERGLNQDAEALVFPRTRRFRSTPPGVKPARRDVQATTQDRHRMVGLFHGNEPESYRLCLAKKAVAFLRMSRSSARMRTSLRSRASSSRSSFISPLLPLVRSASACFTQRP